MEDSWTGHFLLALGCAALVWATFLQEAAYVAILLGGYLLWSAFDPACRRRAFFAAGAAGAGLATGLPRLWLVGRELKLLVRQGGDRSFAELFEYQNVRPWELLRFFDGTIFGRSQSETALSNLNFTEGFQLFTAQASPFLLIAGWMAYRSGAPKADKFRRPELAYFLTAFIATAAVVGSKWAYYGALPFFGGMDFYHSCVIVAGLAPLTILIVVALSRLHSAASRDRASTVIEDLAGVTLGIGLALLVHAVAGLAPPTAWALVPAGKWHWADPNRLIHIRWQAVDEVLLTGGAVGAVIGLAFCGQWTLLRKWRPACAAVLCAMTVTQALLAARFQLTGPQTESAIPFEAGNNWQPSGRLFHLPSATDLALLHDRLESDRFRGRGAESGPASSRPIAK